uniref:MULE transposase domain-containing protein n=1 Tax=Tanacetum cinerariifolium TaxID=118510 RepID=A0A6L2LLL4_TANCI|nr:hypothetical protein [Tanacetum cinerariifolium]
MTRVLGMKYEHPEQLKQSLANYRVANGYQLWYAKNDWRSLLVYCGGSVKGESSKSAKSAPKSSKKSAKSSKCAGKSDGKSTKSAGSTCRLEAEEVSSSSTYFKRFYICFKGLKHGWLDGCRRIIGLDGCFLKHTCKGNLLTAMGKDANNKMYPIAWAVVKVKNIDNWSWFLSLLYDDLNLQQGTGLTLISDSHKVNMSMPTSKRNIVVYSFKDYSGGAASSTVEELFYAKMDDLKYINLEAYEYLRLVAMNKLAVNLEDQITPTVRKRLEYLKQEQRNWLWQLSGVPCIHVVAGYMHLNKDLDKGVHFSYNQEGLRAMPGRPKKKRIKATGENNSQVTRLGKQIKCFNCQGVGHNKASCKNPSVPKLITTVKKVSGRRREPNVQYASAKSEGRGSRGGGRGAMDAKSGGRGQIGVESGGRGGMGSGIGAMSTDSGGRGRRSDGRATMGGARGRRGGARGRRGGGRGGRRGGGRGSTSGLKVYDIRQSMEDEYMQGVLDEQEDLRRKQEKEHQDKLDEEALKQAREEDLMFERMDLEREREKKQ